MGKKSLEKNDHNRWLCGNGETEKRVQILWNQVKKIDFKQEKNIVQFALSEEIEKESNKPNMSFTLTETSMDVSLMDFYLLRKSFITLFATITKKNTTAPAFLSFSLSVSLSWQQQPRQNTNLNRIAYVYSSWL